MQFQVFYRCFIFFYLFLKCLKFIVNRANVFSPLKSLPNTPMALRMSESPRFSNVRFLWVCLVSCRLSSSFKGPGFNSTSQTCCKTMSTIVATTNTQRVFLRRCFNMADEDVFSVDFRVLAFIRILRNRKSILKHLKSDLNHGSAMT